MKNRFCLNIKKARLSWLFFVLSSFILSPAYAIENRSIFQFLSYDTDAIPYQTVVFNQETGRVDSIKRLRVHYLTSNDCQEGYVSFIDTFDQIPAFPIVLNKSFVLNAETIFQAAKSIADYEHIEAIHSILIRFIGTKGQFAQFTSSCSDEGINCCVPVNCSNATGTCLPQLSMEIQHFTLITDNERIEKV
jgi:hypothetical protein